MRRLVFIALFPLLLVACKRGENPLFSSKLEELDAPVVRPGTRDPKTGKYIPPICEADGSYEQARDCFRRAEVIRFRTSDGLGTMTREAPRRERMMLYIAKGDLRGNWLAVNAPGGALWAFNGAKVAQAPPRLARIFHWVSRFPDPPKKEGTPRLLGRDDKAITYEFTDSATGDRYVVRVHPATGHLLELSTAGMSLKFG